MRRDKATSDFDVSQAHKRGPAIKIIQKNFKGNGSMDERKGKVNVQSGVLNKTYWRLTGNIVSRS